MTSDSIRANCFHKKAAASARYFSKLGRRTARPLLYKVAERRQLLEAEAVCYLADAEPAVLQQLHSLLRNARVDQVGRGAPCRGLHHPVKMVDMYRQAVGKVGGRLQPQYFLRPFYRKLAVEQRQEQLGYALGGIFVGNISAGWCCLHCLMHHEMNIAPQDVELLRIVGLQFTAHLIEYLGYAFQHIVIQEIDAFFRRIEERRIGQCAHFLACLYKYLVEYTEASSALSVTHGFPGIGYHRIREHQGRTVYHNPLVGIIELARFKHKRHLIEITIAERHMPYAARAILHGEIRLVLDVCLGCKVAAPDALIKFSKILYHNFILFSFTDYKDKP